MRFRLLLNIFTFVLIVAFLWFYFRYIERKSVFFPTRDIEYKPDYIGLEYEDVYFNTSDGKKLNGWFIPAGDSDITILFSHGNGGNISHRLEILKMFNSIGLNTFIYDYRGYGKSEGVPSEVGLYQDVEAAYNYLVKQRHIKPEDILLYGESLGSAVNIYLANKNKVTGVITNGCFTSTKDMVRQIYPLIPAQFLVTMKFDSLSRIKRIKVPILIIHSKDDEIVPFMHGERLFKAANEPKDFCQLRGPHNEATILEEDKFKNAIKHFLFK